MAILQFPKNNASVTALYDGDLFTHADGTPRLWWVKPSLWAERELADSITRTTEDRALNHIHVQARALRRLHKYASGLSVLEQAALTLERRCRHDNPHLSGWYMCEWIAERMPGYTGEWTPRRVRAVIDDANDVINAYEQEHMIDVLVRWGRRKMEKKAPILTLVKTSIELKRVA